MESTTVVVIGGGQAGLAMSRCLTDRSIEHVVLERGTVANSWRTERWDSLRLLTPNWLSRLPRWGYRGADPDGYMTAEQVAGFLDDYRASFAAPVICGAAVRSVEATSTGFVVSTNDQRWQARAVVVATGACSDPRIPAISSELPTRMQQLAPIHYRNPGQVGDGAVLVVGASASGAQIADELARVGRPVTLAVGDHVRLPRRYRGKDIHWWMDAIGQLDDCYQQVEDLVRARRLPSLQLVGSPTHRNLGLNEMHDAGVRVTGRFVGVAAGRAQFSGSFANLCRSADLKQGRLLDEIDDFVVRHDLDAAVDRPHRPAPTAVPAPPLELELSEFSTVIWATGFRPTYPWLPPHMLDRKGAIVHDGGVMSHPGMYVLGLPFMRRRKSSFLDGVGLDAADLAAHLSGFLAAQVVR